MGLKMVKNLKMGMLLAEFVYTVECQCLPAEWPDGPTFRPATCLVFKLEQFRISIYWLAIYGGDPPPLPILHTGIYDML